MIVRELVDHTTKLADGRRITDLRLGLGYTAVLLDDGSCGLSYTFRREMGDQCGVLDGAGSFCGMSASDAAVWAMDTNLAKASIGIAAINAILSRDLCGFGSKNAMDEINIRPGDVLGMIGYFEPVVKKHGFNTSKMYIFDRVASSPEVLPDWAENIYLPECDVVVITGTTLVNKTIDHVLSLCKKAHEIVLMGPTTCLVPEVFYRHGVNVLAGSRVTDARKALKTVSEGGGGLDMKSAVEQLCIRL